MPSSSRPQPPSDTIRDNASAPRFGSVVGPGPPVRTGRTLRRVGVEVGVLGPAKAGVARYLWNMVQEMMLAAPEVEFLFYSAWPVEIPLAPGNWRLREPAGAVRRVFELWVQFDLPRLLVADGVDVFWGQGYVVPHRAMGRCARVLTIHDLTPMLFPRSMELHTRISYGLLMRAAARSADAVVAVSKATARLTQLLLGVGSDRLRVIGEGVDQRIRPMDAGDARRCVDARFGLTGEFVLCVGTIEPRKNLPVLIDAICMLDGPPPLVFAGAPGWRCRSLMAAIRERERAGGVRYLGPVTDDELAALYGSARLMVYPSLYEGFGLPVLEAMACGCPVLCSWSSSLPEVGGSAARYFRPRDPGDLAHRLECLLCDPEELQRMSLEGVAQAAKFGYAKAARELLDVFAALASQRGVLAGQV